MAAQDKATELDLYAKWKKEQNVQAFQGLYKSMQGMLYDAARKASYGSNLPESAHRAWAAQSFMDALRTYDPKSGAALQTHVYGSVHQKAKRLNYLYQNLGQMPEPRIMQVGLYQSEFENLRSKLNREPSTAEVADQLGWNIREVVNIQKEVQKEYGLSQGLEEVPFFENSKEEEILDYIYYELSDEEKVVYDYIFGKHGRPRMVKANNKIDFDGIAEKVGYSQSKARMIFIRIRDKLTKALKR